MILFKLFIVITLIIAAFMIQISVSVSSKVSPATIEQSKSFQSSDDELNDFEFDNINESSPSSTSSLITEDDYVYPDETIDDNNSALNSNLDETTYVDDEINQHQQEEHVADRRIDDFDFENIDLSTSSSSSPTSSVSVSSIGEKENQFKLKEKRIYNALQRAITDPNYMRKFALVFPIMRSLTKQQRIVLASLIAAQMSSSTTLIGNGNGNNQGKGLTLEQVESMFGDRRKLMLPILFNIANLVRSAATSAANIHQTKSSSSSSSAIREIEQLPSAQLLKRRSLSDQDNDHMDDILQLITTTISPLFDGNNNNQTIEMVSNVAAAAVAAISVTEVNIPQSLIRDDRLLIDEDDDDVKIKNIDISSTKDEISIKGRALMERLPSIPTSIVPPPPRPPPPPPPPPPSSSSSSYSQQFQQPPAKQKLETRSYHERKLNMTNFNGTHDQFAMESESVSRSFVINPNMTLEQYEELAFSDLNDTDTTIPAFIRNETTGEILPMPAMLIARYKKNPYRKLSNSIEGLKTCERFGNLCLKVEDYPMQAIMGSIRRHKHAMSALLAEFIDKEDLAISRPYLEDVKRREDDELTPSGMCPSIIRYARPQKARSATGEWKYIVNTGQHTQTLRLEKCSKPEESCTYLTDNFHSRCVQIFNYHRLLSWDNTRGLHIDIFKIPTCCSCHIDAYREKFPPINSYTSSQEDYGFSAASNIHSHRHHSPYATILGGGSSNGGGGGSSIRGGNSYSSASDEDEDDDDSIAYQYSNGFKRSPNKLNKYSDSALLGSHNKPRYEKTKHSKLPSYLSHYDSYLTPPTTYDFDSPYKRGSSVSSSGSSSSSGGGSSYGRKRRRPVRTNSRDQALSGSDFLPDITLVPSYDYHNTEHPSLSIKRKSSSISNSFTSSSYPLISTKRVSIGTMSQQQQQQQQQHHQQQEQQHHKYHSGTVTAGGQLPSISTASTSAVDLGKRVNYNYHPIIDFFGDSLKSDKEINDRVGYSEQQPQQQQRPTWRPYQQNQQQMIRRRQR